MSARADDVPRASASPPAVPPPMRHRLLPRLALLAALAALTIACGQRVAVAPGPAMPARDTVVISDSPYGAYVGSPISLDARVWRDGMVDPAAPVEWSVTPLDVAWIADDGTLTPLGEGRVTITARAGKSRTQRSLVVRRNPTRRVGFVTPSRDDLHPGDSVRVIATARDADDSTLRDVRVTYGIATRGDSAPAARVSASGMFAASEPGIYTVIAEAGGLSDAVLVMVRPEPIPVASADSAAPASSTGGATARRVAELAEVVVRAAPTRKVKLDDSDFAPYALTTTTLAARVFREGADAPDSDAWVEWESSDTSVAWVSEGVVAFRRAGLVTIAAVNGGKRGTRTFDVRERPIVHMVLNTSASLVATGDRVKFHEWAWQFGGFPVKNARVNYAIVAEGHGDARAATIDEGRVFTARAPGVYTVIAEIGGIADKVTFLVHDRRNVARAVR